MEKSLKKIQTVFRIGKILSIVALVISALGVLGCIYNFGFSGSVMAYKDAGGTHVFRGILEEIVEITEESRLAVFATLSILYASGAVVAGFALRYFNNELVEGTPFTFSGADDMKTLGIITIAVPTAAKAVVLAIFAIFADVKFIDIDFVDDTFILGIMFLVMSLIFRYGAALREEKYKNPLA